MEPDAQPDLVAIRNLATEQTRTAVAIDNHLGSVQDQLYRLEDRFERLVLLTEALAELATERLGVTADELAAKITEIDGRDGAVDGRQTRLPTRCARCRAAVPPGRAGCVFCGAEQPIDPLGAI